MDKTIPPEHRAPSASPWREHGIYIGLYALFMLVMFGDVLFSMGSRVLGNQTTDLYLQFVAWRGFGFKELAHGNFALWNPHIYGGAPYFGGMQSALLYPPNIVFLILPLVQAINWSIALHVFMMGVFMYWWGVRRGLLPLAAFMTGGIMMFCGPFFLRVYAGHLTNISTMVWVPLLFLAIDGFFETRAAGWCLLGAFDVALQIFGGHPQYVFYTALIAGLYSALRLTGEKQRGKLIAGLLFIYPAGAVLAAVQLITGMQAASETIRNVSVPFRFASMFGFPPENLITLVAPGFFGDMVNTPYWGRCYLWEMSLFIGVTGFALAVYGAIYGKSKTKWILLSLIPVIFILALGVHTPLFRMLYDWVPGFSKFRAISKFVFLAALFLAMLAGMGMDHLLRRGVAEKKFVIGLLCSGGVIFLASFVIMFGGALQGALNAVAVTGESYLMPHLFEDPLFIQGATSFAADSLLLSAGICLLLAGLFWGVGKQPYVAYGIVGLALLEVFMFAKNSRETFDSETVVMPEIKQFLDSHPGDYRIINPMNPNSAMLDGAQDMWGFDPGVVRRYAEFMAWTQDEDPDDATQYVNFQKLDPLYAMLRCRYVFTRQSNELGVIESKDFMPRLQLVQNYRVIPERDRIFSAMRNEQFDPRRDVILEHEPEPKPVAGSGEGTAKIVDSSTDWLVVEADLQKPAILLITDAYTPSWRAVSLPGSVQAQYDLEPANYVLRSIALQAGHHHLRIEYAPKAYRVGKWISIISGLCFMMAVIGMNIKWLKSVLLRFRAEA